jgi:hypothetical protein
VKAEDYRSRLAGIYGGKRWILVLEVLAGATPLVEQLGLLGAERCLCIATSRGTGPAPDDALAPDPIVIEIRAPDMMTGVRQSLALFANLPAEVVERIDAFDAHERARVIGSILDDGRPVGRRRKYGARPASWQALEDKTRVDVLWDEVGIARAPSRVVAAAARTMDDARSELDAGDGCILAGDSREGFNGGASYLRWVRSAAELKREAPFFEAHCDRVRVMPFLEGIPCSIHGLVFDDHTMVLRPCEMLVFRRPDRSDLHYGRAATFWDPPDADRTAMRAAARRIGDHLRSTMGYRGAFTLDGVLTAEGFLPTELNPRFGAALAVLTSELDVPLMLLNLAVVEGERVDWQPRALERMILEVADTHRAGGGMAMTSRVQTETQLLQLTWTGSTFRIAEPSEKPDATALIGPAATGGCVKVTLSAETTPVGPSAAARVASALGLVDAHWDLGIGSLEPAVDVRRA